MGFMEKAKKLAEQAQHKLDEAQHQFQQGQSQTPTSGEAQSSDAPEAAPEEQATPPDPLRPIR